MGETRIKKILVATPLYPPEIGGPATYARMLEKELPAHHIELEILPFGKVRHLPKIIRHIAYIKLLLGRSKHFDIVYSLDPVSVGVPIMIASFITRKRYILRVAGDYAWEQGQQHFGVTDLLDEYIEHKRNYPFMVRLFAWLQSKVAARALHIIVPSKYMKGIVSKWGITTSKISVVYSALSPLKVEGTRDKIRKKLSYRRTVIISAGRLVPWKGFLTLLEVVAELQSDISFVIAGDGPERGVLEERAKELGINNRVSFEGILSREKLGEAIKGADVFVLNTAYEGLSHQLLEVMDLGVPIVTTNVGGNPELIEDGVSGILVPFDDKEALVSAILRVLQNVRLRERMVQNARLATKRFDQKVVAGELATFLNKKVWNHV